MNRRHFLLGSLAAAGAAMAAPEGIPLGYDTYSLRAWKWKALQHLDYAARMNLDTVQLSSLDDFESFDPAYLARVKDKARASGLSLDGGTGCICPLAEGWKNRNETPAQYLIRSLRVSQAIGATSMRCFMAGVNDRRGKVPVEALIEKTAAVLKSVRSQALDMQVKVAVENHGDMQARELRALIEEAGRDFVGACLDTGNPVSVMEDPFVTLEVLAPYTVTTHVRDSVVFEHPRGAAVQWVALGDGVIDFRRWVTRFAELCPGVAMQLENITGRPPSVLPYLEPDFWRFFPKANASEFARFVGLARGGHPSMSRMIVADSPGETPPEYTAALRAQQRTDLEAGFSYARKLPGVGRKLRMGA